MIKKCFKSIFGTTIGTWLTQYRMNWAAVLLKTERKMSVAEIAGRGGYDSPSKFAAAYTVKVVFFGLSTGLSHYAAYHILEKLRQRMADRHCSS